MFKAIFLCAVGAWCLAQTGDVGQPRVADDAFQNVIDRAIANVKPALVRIHVVTVYDDQGRKGKYESAGSGIIITSEGHVVTNHHVAGKAKRLMCTLYNRQEVEADLVATDPLSDISVIKIRNPDERIYQTASFGNSDALEVGDYILAMGSPMALSQSVTMGIVSNTEMVLPDIFGSFKFTLEGEDVGSVVRWIGHDAPIYPGNSGGALVNLDGEIVGINEINLGISGAIPGNLAREVVEELIRDGRVKRAWFGFEVQPLLKYGKADTGVLISGTIKDSPADQAGFLPGDVLVRINEKPVSVLFNEELPLFNHTIMSCPIGIQTTAVVIRNGKEKVLHVTAKDREYIRPEAVEVKHWGITARDITFLAAKEMKRDDENGVLVTSVQPSGPCGEAKPGITPGDVIVAINGKRVNRLSDFEKMTEKLIDDTEELVPVLVTFERRNNQYITVCKIGSKKLEEQGQELAKAWLGVGLQVLTRDIAEHNGLGDQKGVRIVQVFEDSPAEKAGLSVGDIIVGVNNVPVEASEPADIEILPAMIRRFTINEETTLQILRDRKPRDITIRFGSSPPPPREMRRFHDENFEFMVRDIAFQDRIDQIWNMTQTGVIVADVSSGSWAALANLVEGDLILAVNGTPMHNVEDFEDVMSGMQTRRPKNVVLKVLRGIHTFFVELEPDW
jgi:serine protease Do